MLEQKRNMTDVGDVKIHNEAIRSITELTVLKIDGVIRINKSPWKKILDNLGLSGVITVLDGIRVETTEAAVKIALNIIVAYGADIVNVAAKVQDAVKQAVENMAGISPVEVDVNVSGVEVQNKV